MQSESSESAWLVGFAVYDSAGALHYGNYELGNWIVRVLHVGKLMTHIYEGRRK